MAKVGSQHKVKDCRSGNQGRWCAELPERARSTERLLLFKTIRLRTLYPK